ncbi:MAG: hypothetical protein APF81_21520 [Desulfosporosinus sp. BRH_c37]|nr:MAG: hypothetical protein APF81_21520 [Desulfosporosinus sp. BRH_c37]
MTNDNRVMPEHTSNTSDKLGVSTGTSIVNGLSQVNYFLNCGMAWLAGTCLFLIVLLVVTNVISRAVYVPFSGAEELVGWLAATTTAFALGYTQIKRGYVDIDALTQRFPLFLQSILKRVILICSACFFALISWKLIGYTLTVKSNGNLSETMRIPFYPLIFLLSLGFAGLTIALLTDLLVDFLGEEGKQ